MQIKRHGINKSEDLGPIAKISFEEVSKVLYESSIFSEVDDMNGVSSNIMLGQLCKNVGTNSFGILLDEEKIIENNNKKSNQKSEKIIEDDFDSMIDKSLSDDINVKNITDDSFDFDYSLENVNEHQLQLGKLNINDSKIIGNNKITTIESNKLDDSSINNSKLSKDIKETDDEFEETDDEFEESDDEFEETDNEKEEVNVNKDSNNDEKNKKVDNEFDNSDEESDEEFEESDEENENKKVDDEFDNSDEEESEKEIEKESEKEVSNSSEEEFEETDDEFEETDDE